MARARSTPSPVPGPVSVASALRREVERFDPSIPVERAHTPPASWYLDPAFHDLERDTVFSHNWITVGRTQQLERPGDYLAGDVLDMLSTPSSVLALSATANTWTDPVIAFSWTFLVRQE